MLFALNGLLGLLGVPIFKGSPLDPRWDHGEPAPPPELMRADRLAEDPMRPGQRWLPVDFATFPDRCVACGRPPAGFWKIHMLRGVDLILGAFHQVNWIAAPVCAHCRRQRRMTSFILFTSMLWPFLLLFFLDEGLNAIEMTTPVVMLGLALTFVAVAFVRTWGPPLLDDALLGVSGGRLEKGGRSGWLRFRKPELAEEVATLTRNRMRQMESVPGFPRLPTHVGTT